MWTKIKKESSADNSKICFLNVGQGDSILYTGGQGIQILTDTGPDSSIVEELEKTMPDGDRDIDLIIITHPEHDHVGGLISALNHYSVGAIIWNGSYLNSDGSGEWESVKNYADSKKIPVLSVSEGDLIKIGDDVLEILSPSPLLKFSASLNESAIVSLLSTESMKVILTGDIGASVEKYLIDKYGEKLKSQIMKVGHHGSKNSSSEEFVRVVNPDVAVIQSGKNNKYGHPAEEIISRLEDNNTEIFRNDQLGTICITPSINSFVITSDKNPTNLLY